MTALLAFDRVSKTYGEGGGMVRALNAVDLKIERGEFVAVPCRTSRPFPNPVPLEESSVFRLFLSRLSKCGDATIRTLKLSLKTAAVIAPQLRATHLPA